MNIFEHAEEVREVLELMLQPEIEIPKLLPDGSNAEAYGWVLKEIDARQEALKKTKQDIDKKMKALSGRSDRMKEALKKALEMTGQKKLQTETFTYSTRASKSVVVTAESVWEIPEELLRFSDPEPDKVAIKAYLQENPDCAFAHMEEKTSLVIK